MAQAAERVQQDAARKLVEFVLQRIRAGADKAAIAREVEQMGMEHAESVRFVDAVHTEAVQTAVKERPTAGAVLAGLIGGVLAAVIGGVVWGFIATRTGYEIGYVAWGVGMLSGLAVVIFARGRKGLVMQAVAVLSGLMGITVGKYYAFVHYLRQALVEQYGANAGEVSMFSARVVQFFVEKFTVMLSGFDALWVVLAVVTAWRIPKALGIKPPAVPISPIKM